MPKLGATPAPERPYNTRCANCKCLVEKLVSRFGFDGKPKAWQYRCKNPYHNCGTVERDGCTPVRVYGEPVAHDAYGGGVRIVTHPGPAEDCEAPECIERMTHKAVRSDERHPGPYAQCQHEDCEPPF